MTYQLLAGHAQNFLKPHRVERHGKSSNGVKMVEMMVLNEVEKFTEGPAARRFGIYDPTLTKLEAFSAARKKLSKSDSLELK